MGDVWTGDNNVRILCCFGGDEFYGDEVYSAACCLLQPLLAPLQGAVVRYNPYARVFSSEELHEFCVQIVQMAEGEPNDAFFWCTLEKTCSRYFHPVGFRS